MMIFFAGHPNNGRNERVFTEKRAQTFFGIIGKIREKSFAPTKISLLLHIWSPLRSSGYDLFHSKMILYVDEHLYFC